MDFNYNDAQKNYQRDVTSFAQGAKKELVDLVVQLDRTAEFNRQGWQLCAEFGIQGGPIPTQYGGKGLALMTYIAGLESLGMHCRDNGLLFSIGAHVLACELPILSFGTEVQKQQWLPLLSSGEKIAAIAIAEAHGSSDAFNINTTATQSRGGYILNGKKSYITNSTLCDVALVFARVSDTANKVICLLVDRNTPGMHCEAVTDSSGLRTSPWGDIIFDDCWVDQSQQLGASGELVFMSAMEWERGCILAPLVGAMQRQLNDCITRVRTRKQGEQALSDHQAVSHRIVEMKMRADLARLQLYQFAFIKDTRRRANMEAVMTKWYLSESYLQNSMDAMQLHGGFGYSTDAGIEREVRDALGLRIASGTSDIQKNIIAKWLKL